MEQEEIALGVADNSAQVTVDSAEAPVTTSDIDEAQEEQEALVQDGEQPEKENKSKRYSQNLNKAREEAARARAELEESKREREVLEQNFKAAGYEGTLDDISLKARANYLGVTVSELKAQMKNEEEQVKLSPAYRKMQAELEMARTETAKNWERDVLKEIKQINPKESAKGISELGEQFLGFIRAGVEPGMAYGFLQQAKQAKTKPTPPDIGAIGKAEGVDELSDEKINSFTKEDYRKDPKLLDRVLASLKKKGIN